MIANNVFSILWAEALDATDRDAYVSDWALSSIWEDDPESEIPQERVDYLRQIWDGAHMSVKEICKTVGLTQAGLAQRFCIPKRTVEDWCRGVSKCPDYTRLMMMELLGLIRR
jgi:DNA-binding transcriptional regulator YiaG